MAAGNLLVDFSPQSSQPPTTGAATPDVRNGHPLLAFADDTDQAAVFTGFLPWHYSGGGITAYVTAAFSDDANPAHAAQLRLAFERISPGGEGLDEDGFAGPQSVTVSVPAVNGQVAVGSVSFAPGDPIDHLAAGEMFCLRVQSDTAASSYSGKLQLLRVVLRETG